MKDFLFSGRNWNPWINSQVWLIWIKWMKLIDLEMLLHSQSIQRGATQGVSVGMRRGRASHCFGARCQPVLDLGGVQAAALSPGWECWDNGLDAQYGRAGLSSSGSRGQHQCSGVLMSDLRKMVEEDGGMEGHGEKKWREGVGGVSGRERTVKPWENGGWDLFLQDNRDWPMKMHPSQGH